MDEIMNSVSVQIQRAINDAISNQVLPKIQNAIMAGPGHMTKNGWNVSGERPDANPEVPRSEKARNDLRSEQFQSRQYNDHLDDHIASDSNRNPSAAKIELRDGSRYIHIQNFYIRKLWRTKQTMH